MNMPGPGTWWIFMPQETQFSNVPHVVVEVFDGNVIAWSHPLVMPTRSGHTWRGPIAAFMRLFKPANP